VTLASYILNFISIFKTRLKALVNYTPLPKALSPIDPSLSSKVLRFCATFPSDRPLSVDKIDSLSADLRNLIRDSAGLNAFNPNQITLSDLISELNFLTENSQIVRIAFQRLSSKRVLFSGQCYYNKWYLSRALRQLGWKADLYNWDQNPSSSKFYHGQDFQLGQEVSATPTGVLSFYLTSLYQYDLFHFSNVFGISFSSILDLTIHYSRLIHLLKLLGKSIVYTNTGCLDGVSQTSFSLWGPNSVCSICRWQDEPSVCNDERNLVWGRFRNEVSDFQCLAGGNRIDFNIDNRIHEVPQVFCLSPDVWNPNVAIPSQWQLPENGNIRLYHAVGNASERTRPDGKNIKSSHVYFPLIESLKKQGHPIELVNPVGVDNLDIRYLQAQSDIFLEMLTFGWFGANAREALMLGKPVICFIRPEWLESVRSEIPEYAEELPIVSATPDTVEDILVELLSSSSLRKEIGIRSREFALKWHSSEAGGRKFDSIYSFLLSQSSSFFS
jgi:hypothetical protein